jgi:hypothetical protein
VDLAASLEGVDALLGGDDVVAVEVSRALLELGEVLDAAQGALRAEAALDVHAAQARGIDAVAEPLRPDIADLVGGAVGVPVGVAIEAGHAARRQFAAAVFRLVELLLWKGGDEQAKALQVLRVQDPVERLSSIARWRLSTLGLSAVIRLKIEAKGSLISTGM